MCDIAYDIQQIQVQINQKTLFACGQLTIPNQALTAIIGPNGAGKSTLLRALAGFHGHCRGSLLGKPLRHDLALGGKTLAWVAQHQAQDSPLALSDYILLGRRPLLGQWGRPSAADRAAVDAVMAELELSPLAQHPLGSLSGGERQLAAIARAVVQQTPVILLDEPGNHLDIRHQHLMMALLQRLARQGHSVVCVLHDLALAANYAQQMILVAEGGVAQTGPVEQVLQPQLLSRLYRWPIVPRQAADGCVWQVDTQPAALAAC